MWRVLLLPVFLFGFELHPGWNLLGAKLDFNATFFQRVEIAWKYENEWKCSKYISGFAKIERVKAGEGFWIYSDKEAVFAPYLERGLSWYWQLQGEVDENRSANVYDIDLFDSSKELIERLHQKKKVVICYFSAGSYEDWRSDKDRFPDEVLGRPLDGWEGERWLDIRSPVVREIMKDRLELARQKSCDGVEADNVDAYTNESGFNLSASDQLSYNRFLASEAHKRGLLIGLKNDLEQIPQLVEYFDFAINEQCFEFNECERYLPFLVRNKAVFNAEYMQMPDCKKSKLYGISAAFYNEELDGNLYRSCF